jgi:hypothetical protein
MMYPLVRELAGDGIPVTVTCRVLKIVMYSRTRLLMLSSTATTGVVSTAMGTLCRTLSRSDAAVEAGYAPPE